METVHLSSDPSNSHPAPLISCGYPHLSLADPPARAEKSDRVKESICLLPMVKNHRLTHFCLLNAGNSSPRVRARGTAAVSAINKRGACVCLCMFGQCDCQHVALSVSPIFSKRRLEKLSAGERSVNCALSCNPSSVLCLWSPIITPSVQPHLIWSRSSKSLQEGKNTHSPRGYIGIMMSGILKSQGDSGALGKIWHDPQPTP